MSVDLTAEQQSLADTLQMVQSNYYGGSRFYTIYYKKDRQQTQAIANVTLFPGSEPTIQYMYPHMEGHGPDTSLDTVLKDLGKRAANGMSQRSSHGA